MPVPISPRARRWLVATLISVAYAGGASAQLSLFRSEMQAQQHCPTDTVVWLDTYKRIYYVTGQQRYARGSTGTFVCQKEARTSGYRRSVLGRR